MKKLPAFSLASGFLLLAGVGNMLSADIVNDQFTDGNRSSQTPALGSPPYSSIRWYSTQTDSVTTGTDGMGQSLAAGARTLWGYFTTQGSPVSLATGESLRMTFDYTYQTNTGGSSGMMRFGIYDGGSGTRPVTEGTIASPSTFALSTLKGYGFEINSQAASATGSIMKREINSATDTGLFGGSGYSTVGASFSSIDAGNTKRTGQITIVNNGTSVSVTLNPDVATASGTTITDTSASRITTFDMAAFLNYSNSGTNKATFDNIKVEHITSSPTLIDEKFTDGERVTQTPALGAPPYTSMRWVSSQADTVNTAASGMDQTLSSSPRYLWTYFSPQNSPVTLGKSETVQLTFDYTYVVNSVGNSGMMRFGLFHGGSATRDFTEGTSAVPAPFNQNTLKGYAVETNAQAVLSTSAVLKRQNNNGVNTGIFTSGTGGTYSSVKTSSGSDSFPSFDATTVTRTAQFTITNKGSWNLVTVDFDTNTAGGVTTFNETAMDRVTAFDLIAFANYSNSGANTITIDNVHLDYFQTADQSAAPTDGGDGGQLVTVTSLADSGTGTLREALAMTMPRTIKFNVGGEIMLNSQLTISSPCVTVDGLSAPSPGISVKGDRLWLSPSSHDIVLRHLRIRVGELITGSHTDADTHDGISVNTSNVLVENCSVSWSVDELMEIWGTNLSNIVIRNNIFAEALKTSVHPKGDHSMGVLVGPGSRNVIIQGNLFAHVVHRNPVVHANAQALVINNLIYHPGFEGFHIYTDPDYPGATLASVVGNKLIGWPTTNIWYRPRYPLCAAAGYNAGTQIYYNDNAVEGLGVVAFDPAETFGSPAQPVPVVSTPPIAISITPMASSLVEASVLSNAGARPTNRDATDTRIISEVTTRTGSIRDNPTDPSITVP